MRKINSYFLPCSSQCKYLILIPFFLCYLITTAQQETYNWYFGYGAGLDFSKGKPVFQKGKINQWEGCASISDSKGQLLFYTNGIQVWDRNHKVMPNGKGLKGDNSSTQSSIIVPDPGSRNKYYLFTIAAEAATSGMQYSVVDMEANGGIGDVTEKNISLLAPVCEKITAVRHINNKDVWMITHKYNSDEYYAYLVTGKGINEQPVISQTENIITGRLNTIGYLKSSPTGTKLAAAHLTSFVELLDFDPASGNISNAIKIVPQEGTYPYGVEFSKGGSFLYLTTMANTNGTGGYNIFQYRVSGNADSVLQSKYVVGAGDVGGAAGALQLGADNKMYVAFNKKSFLGCITQPDKETEKCDFVLEYIQLEDAKSGLGLPSFIQSYFINAGLASGYLKYITGFILFALLLLLFFLYRRRKEKRKDKNVS